MNALIHLQSVGQIVHQIDWEKVVRVFSALLTPVIAGVTVYIAWQQHRINRNQYRLALFDRRHKIFDATTEFIVVVLRAARATVNDLSALVQGTRGHEFLFDSDVSDYINQLYGKGAELLGLEGAPPEDAPKQRTAILLWFGGQNQEATKKFGKYMAFKEPD